MPGLMVTIIDHGRDNVFSNNTIHLTGASATLSIGDAPTVMHNEVWNTGLLQSDGAVVQMMMAEQKDAHIAYNWIQWEEQMKEGMPLFTTMFCGM